MLHYNFIVLNECFRMLHYNFIVFYFYLKKYYFECFECECIVNLTFPLRIDHVIEMHVKF